MSDKQIEIERAEFWSAVLDCDYNKYMKLKESHGELLGLVRAFNISNPLSVYRDKADAAIAKAEKTREGEKQ